MTHYSNIMGVENVEKPGTDKGDMLPNVNTRQNTQTDTKNKDET